MVSVHCSRQLMMNHNRNIGTSMHVDRKTKVGIFSVFVLKGHNRTESSDLLNEEF